MPILTVPRPLEEQLGTEATNGLVEILNEMEKAAKEDVILIAEQKYERRLTEETAKLDKRITDEMAKLRSQDLPKLDKRISEETAKLDKRITDEMARLRSEDLPKLGRMITTSKVDMIKWMVALFMTQIGILTAIMALLLR